MNDERPVSLARSPLESLHRTQRTVPLPDDLVSSYTYLDLQLNRTVRGGTGCAGFEWWHIRQLIRSFLPPPVFSLFSMMVCSIAKQFSAHGRGAPRAVLPDAQGPAPGPAPSVCLECRAAACSPAHAHAFTCMVSRRRQKRSSRHHQPATPPATTISHKCMPSSHS